MIQTLLTPIGEFCQSGSGTTPSRERRDEFYGGSVPWVKSGELRERVIERTEEMVTEAALRATSLKRVPAGALLIAMYGATVGRVGMLGVDATTNQAVCHLIPDPKRADRKYLFYALRTKAAELIARGVGGAQPNISQGTIRQTRIYLPPLSEQKRIAAILDEAEYVSHKRQEFLGSFDRLGSAIFRQMFGDVRVNDARWQDDAQLSDLCDIASGITKGRKLNGQPTRNVPYMTVATVQDGYLKLDTVKTIAATKAEIERYRLRPDDILLTEGGDPDKLGRGAIWNGELDECIHQNHVFRVRVRDDRLHPVFATWLLGSVRGKAYFLRSAKQTTGIASINSTQLKMFPVLLPPQELQALFAARLEKVARERVAVQRAFESSRKLFSSLQHRAFRGEL